MAGVIESSPLPQLSPNLAPPIPLMAPNAKTGVLMQKCVTLSAGIFYFVSIIFCIF